MLCIISPNSNKVLIYFVTSGWDGTKKGDLRQQGDSRTYMVKLCLVCMSHMYGMVMSGQMQAGKEDSVWVWDLGQCTSVQYNTIQYNCSVSP